MEFTVRINASEITDRYGNRHCRIVGADKQFIRSRTFVANDAELRRSGADIPEPPVKVEIELPKDVADRLIEAGEFEETLSEDDRAIVTAAITALLS